MGTPVRAYEYGLNMVEFYGSGLSIIAALLSEPRVSAALPLFSFSREACCALAPLPTGRHSSS